MSTIRPVPNFNAQVDAETLQKHMKGWGCNTTGVISILCCRTNGQRQQIKQAFKGMFGKDLVQELISELKGNLEAVIVALMCPPAEYDAFWLRRAMAGAGTTESILIEIMCSRTPFQLRYIKQSYGAQYNRSLEKDLISETSGNFQRLLVSLCNATRDETQTVDQGRARQDAVKLYDAGEAKWGTDETMFNMILCQQNYSQLQHVFAHYKTVAGRDIEDSIHREFSGDIRDGLIAVVRCIKSRPHYFAERLYTSMKGVGTDDDTLVRIIVSRVEIDMQQIKQAFLALYGKTLYSFIKDDTSGKYETALLTLIN